MIEVSSGSNEVITYKILGTTGGENISSLNHVRIVLVSNKGVATSYLSTNPVGQDEVVTVSDSLNGEVTLELAQDTIDEDLGPYSTFMWLYTTSTKRTRAPSSGVVYLKPTPDFGT